MNIRRQIRRWIAALGLLVVGAGPVCAQSAVAGFTPAGSAPTGAALLPVYVGGLDGNGNMRGLLFDSTTFGVVVTPSNTPNTTAWIVQPVAGTSGGATPFTVKNLEGTVTAVKASGGTLYSLTIANTQTAGTWAYVDVWNVAAGSVTIGVTVPIAEYAVNGGATVTVALAPVGEAYGTAISVASVTASQGGTGSSSGVIVSGSYK